MGNGDVLVYKNIKISIAIISDNLDSDQLLIVFPFLVTLELNNSPNQSTDLQIGSSLKPSLELNITQQRN
jgi:hypothetical protein